jgi:hypothetical protein
MKQARLEAIVCTLGVLLFTCSAAVMVAFAISATLFGQVLFGALALGQALAAYLTASVALGS